MTKIQKKFQIMQKSKILLKYENMTGIRIDMFSQWNCEMFFCQKKFFCITLQSEMAR